MGLDEGGGGRSLTTVQRVRNLLGYIMLLTVLMLTKMPPSQIPNTRAAIGSVTRINPSSVAFPLKKPSIAPRLLLEIISFGA